MTWLIRRVEPIAARTGRKLRGVATRPAEELHTLFDTWWSDRSPGERAYLIVHRHGQLNGEYLVAVEAARPQSGDQPAIATVTDHKTKVFVMGGDLLDYLDLVAAELA